MLSGAFAILSKALSLGCFPRVKVVHTSKKHSGQVYIPEVNFLIGAASIVVTLAFQTTTNIGNAYGICVVTVFSITTHLMTVVMLLIWKKNFAFVVVFYVIFGLAEFLYLSSILSKFVEGGYLPFCLSVVLMALMATWHYVYVKRYWYELDRVVPADQLTALLARRNVRRVGPAEHRMFRCVARCSFTDQIEGTKEFSTFLIEGLKMFVHDEAAFSCQHTDDDGDNNNNDNDARRVAQAAIAEEEKRFIDTEVERGVVYLMGEGGRGGRAGSSALKRIVVNYVYTFLRKNLSESHKALSIPKDQLLKDRMKQIKFMTYNVWCREDVVVYKRMKVIGDHVKEHSPDVIFFQEITPYIHSIFESFAWWEDYHCSPVPTDDQAETRHFCLMLSKIPMKSYARWTFGTSRTGKCYLEAEIRPESMTPITIATTQLECPVPPASRYVRERQMQARHAVSALSSAGNVVFGGDMSWDDDADLLFLSPQAGLTLG
ncbi:hypothetical protein ZWY2020_051282 [Hordeum vulgare]|nr:hypothetical protein ZWY2020_051282 [Hordeum vulgare]